MGKPIELNTERLLLRPIRLWDVVDFYEYAQDQEWARYFNPHTLEYCEKFVSNAVMAPWEDSPRFSIVFNSKVIGGMGLYIQRTDKRAELGYSMAREHWSKGFATEAARAVVRWGFSELDLDKIYAHADAGNQRSWNVMEKLGMTREGVFRSHSLVRGKRRDDVQYGILKEEWLADNKEPN